MSEKRRKAACKKAEKITIINVTAYCLKAKKYPINNNKNKLGDARVQRAFYCLKSSSINDILVSTLFLVFLFPNSV